MRLVYLGTPQSAVPSLLALHGEGHEIVLAVTQPDRKRGRGGALSPSPVKVAAMGLDIPVSHEVDDILQVQADYGVVVVFGKLIKPHVLAHLTFLNLHPSLLPPWRGATPVESAILAGDNETGVCLMQLDEGMDSGPTYACSRTPIAPDETSDQLLARLLDMGTGLLVNGFRDGLPEPQPQVGEPTFAPKITSDSLQIRWDEPTELTLRRIRLGRAWTTFKGARLVITQAEPAPDRSPSAPGLLDGPFVSTADGVVELQQVQPAGKSSMDGSAWANGARLQGNELLGQDKPNRDAADS